ncbi:MAG TPA: hypothetical protein VIG06_18510 [Kofleriaceae bacterium]|jgi:hypothetical protein
MRLVNRACAILLSCGALALVGCGGGDDDGGDPGGQMDEDPAGTDHTYVISELKVPTSANEATQLGLDIDGNGQPDNALGGLLAALAGQADLDLNGTVNEQVASGGIILLANMKATDLSAATGAGLHVYLGDSETAMPAPCTDPENPATCGQHLDGSGMFDVKMDYGAKVVGTIVGGNFTGGPGNITIELALGDAASVPIALIGARASSGVTDSGLTSGKLGGALRNEDIHGELIPAVADLIASLLVTSECGAEAPCCPEGSTGEQILTFFDDNEDCGVTAEELEANSLISSTIGNPDLDLFDENDEFNPRQDGVKDSLSLGIGFTAVAGEFTP